MGEQGRCSRLEGDGGERSIEVGFVEGGVQQTLLIGVDGQPSESDLISGSEEHEGVRLVVPLGRQQRMRHREVESGVDCLAGLRPRRKVSAGDDVEAGALVVAHGL